MLLDLTLRTAGATLLLLTAAVLVLSAPRSPLARWFVPFAFGIAGFLGVNTVVDAAELPPPFWSVASFLSRMAALFLWLFCLALFDGRLRSPRLALAAGAAWLLLVVADKEYLVALPPGVALSPVLVVLGSGLVLHAGWRVMQDLPGDLIEPRRRARPLFALALLGILALDFAADVVQGYGWRPASFVLLQNAMIVALAAALSLWLLRAESWLENAPAPGRPAPVASGAAAFDPGTAARRRPDRAPADRMPLHGIPSDSISPDGRPSDSRPSDSMPTDPDAAVLARLDSLMQSERPYLDPGLTFAQFAARVGLPEPTLRRVINHRLGHGHFRTYLNGYRIEEARRRLRDPAMARDKILAVALESGFSSLASFNRVFRQVVGCSPSEFRGG